MKRKILFFLIFSLAAFNAAAQQIQFEQVPPPPPAPQTIADFAGVENSSIAFADVDGDGDKDVLITGTDNSNPRNRIAKLYTNDGSGNFTEVTSTPFDGVAGPSVFADMDGDGDLDLLISGETNERISINKLYRNLSNPLGVADDINEEANNISIYPNPTDGQINVSLEKEYDEEVQVKVSTIQGKVVHRETLEDSSQILTLPETKGIYIVELLVNGQPHAAQKVVRK